jgi:hypothetical protein
MRPSASVGFGLGLGVFDVSIARSLLRVLDALRPVRCFTQFDGIGDLSDLKMHLPFRCLLTPHERRISKRSEARRTWRKYKQTTDS